MESSLLLDLWREVGRHLELPELLDRVYPRLSDALPVASLFVRRLDLPGGYVETVASLASSDGPPHASARRFRSRLDWPTTAGGRPPGSSAWSTR